MRRPGSPEQAPDLIYANAVLQWLPDHPVLLPRLLGLLAPGGVLAVQMPDNLAEPSHRLMREVAGAGPWAGAIGDPAVAGRLGRMLEPAGYYDLLAPLAAEVDVWRTAYHHPDDGCRRHRRMGQGDRAPALPRPAGPRGYGRVPRRPTRRRSMRLIRRAATGDACSRSRGSSSSPAGRTKQARKSAHRFCVPEPAILQGPKRGEALAHRREPAERTDPDAMAGTVRGRVSALAARHTCLVFRQGELAFLLDPRLVLVRDHVTDHVEGASIGRAASPCRGAARICSAETFWYLWM